MSPHVNNFVTDLVLMAKAMEELPIAQERIKELEAHIDHANETIQSRELSILSYKEDIAQLQIKLNASEVARDDAELRFLELEERVTHAIGYVETSRATLGHALRELNPVVAEPVSTTQPVEAEAIYRVGGQDMGHGSSSDQGSSADPLPQSESWTSPVNTAAAEHTNATATDISSDPSPGQSEADPIAVGNEVSPQSSVSSQHVTSEPAGSVEYAASTSGKYSNKLYEDHPYYVSYDAWIAGGGTEYNYNARRSVSVPIAHTAE